MTWRYEFIATRHPHSNCLILDGGKFKAADICNAREVLASVVRNIKVSGPTKPDAIRLIDPKRREVCRAPLENVAPQSGLASHTRRAMKISLPSEKSTSCSRSEFARSRRCRGLKRISINFI
jgi:hypothetical protein